ncbi:inorganic phosphate transporter [Sporolactobacillus sp. THM7-4]|nr:inorganic phosphate transporter [Sporolactobacillus sp. THM7-4]
MLVLFVFLLSFFFAVNIGASGAATSMGIAYSARALSRWHGVLLSGVGMFLGAWFGGEKVVKTLSQGIVPASEITVKITLMILLGATLTLFLANLSGIPLSTSEVTVGAIVGLGLITQHFYTENLLRIIGYWLVTPVVCFGLALGIGFLLNQLKISVKYDITTSRWLPVLVILFGVFDAFSAGMNNVANAMGPLVSSHLIASHQSVIVGGLFVALGAVTLGHRTLETNGRRISKLTFLEGGLVSFMTASLVVLASAAGIPVPQAQMSTCAILGIGAAKSGRSIFKKTVIKKILAVWVLSPVLSAAVSFGLIQITVKNSANMLVVLIAGCLALAIWMAYRLKHNRIIAKAKGEEIK